LPAGQASRQELERGWFLIIKHAGADQAAAPPQIIVVQHGVEELKHLVSAER